MYPVTMGMGDIIAFGADRVGDLIGICIAFCLHYLLNQLVDFDQTGTDTLLGQGEEVIRFW